jgi:hypothetical protein
MNSKTDDRGETRCADCGDQPLSIELGRSNQFARRRPGVARIGQSGIDDVDERDLRSQRLREIDPGFRSTGRNWLAIDRD